MIRHWLPRSLVVLVAMLAIAGTATTANAQDKLDRALRDGKNSGETLRVIVKAKPGYEAWARQLLQQNGTTIEAEMPSIGATRRRTDRPASSISARARSSTSCSEDSYVSPSTRRTVGDDHRIPELELGKDQRAVGQHVAWHARAHAVGQFRLRRHRRADRLGHLSVERIRRAHQGVLRLHRRHDDREARPSMITVTARTSPA